MHSNEVNGDKKNVLAILEVIGEVIAKLSQIPHSTAHRRNNDGKQYHFQIGTNKNNCSTCIHNYFITGA